MRDFTIAEIKSICDAANLPLGIPFIDNRMDEYAIKYNGNYPYYAAFRDLTKALKPGVVLEIGSWEGTSAAAFAAGCAETQVITIDHHSDPGDHVNQAKTLEAREAYPNITYLQGCSTAKVHALKAGTDFVLPWVEEILSGRKIDILFVDGWHGQPFAQADYDTYKPFLAPGGLIICDDIYGGDCDTIFGMMDFWNDLPGEKYLSTNLHGGYPMGLIKAD